MDPPALSVAKFRDVRYGNFVLVGVIFMGKVFTIGRTAESRVRPSN